MNWKKFVKDTPDKISTPRMACKVSNSHYDGSSKTLLGMIK